MKRTIIMIMLLMLAAGLWACTDDGDTTDGDTTDGDVTDGDATDGDAEDGDTEDGDVEDGDIEDGDTEDGDTTDGDDPWTGNFLLGDTFLNIAHRGGAALAPEDTLVAFQNAVEVGADVLEMDVHATSDGVVVVSHDATVNRMTDGEGNIKDMTFEELRQLDAGYDYSPDGGATYPYRGQGVQIPTLEEVFEALPDMYYTLEIKQSEPNITDAVLGIVLDMGMSDKVVMGAFSDALLREIREKAPELMTGFSTSEVGVFTGVTEADLDSYDPPGQILQLPDMLISENLIHIAELFGLRVHVWTINERVDMENLIDQGVHGIMSDNPQLLQEVMDERGL